MSPISLVYSEISPRKRAHTTCGWHIELYRMALAIITTHQPGAERNRICRRERYAGGDLNLSLRRVKRIHPKFGTFI